MSKHQTHRVRIGRAISLALVAASAGCADSRFGDAGAPPHDAAAPNPDARADASSPPGADGSPSGGPDVPRAPDALAPPPDAPTPPADAGCTSPAAVAIYYGNGAYAISGNWGAAPLAVRVTQCGRPLADTPVAWERTDGPGMLSDPMSGPPVAMFTARTDAAGIARVVFRMPTPFAQPAQSNLPGAVRATVAGASVDFRVTVFNSCPIAGCGSSPPLSPQAVLAEPAEFNLGTHRVGEIVRGAVVVRVANATGVDQGRAVAGVGVRLAVDDDAATEPAPSPIARCAGSPDGTVLTDATGTATCDVEVLAAGTGSVRVLVGESRYWRVPITATR